MLHLHNDSQGPIFLSSTNEKGEPTGRPAIIVSPTHRKVGMISGEVEKPVGVAEEILVHYARDVDYFSTRGLRVEGLGA